MSRDPNAGVLINPKSLHKYLYADGDPINGMDPRGREDLIEYSARLVDALGDEVGAKIYEMGVDAILCHAFAILMDTEAEGLIAHPDLYCELGTGASGI
jgi:hypothetical protein